MSLVEKAFGNTFWVFVGTSSQTLLRFVSSVILARLLSPEEFGVMAMAILVYGVTQILGRLGIDKTLIQRDELTSEDISTGFSLILIFSTIVTTLTAVFSESIAIYFDQLGVLDQVIYTFCPIIFIKPFIDIFIALYRREGSYKFYSTVQVISFFVGNILVSIFLAVLGYGLWSLVWGLVVGHFIFFICLFYDSRKKVRFNFSRDSAKGLLTLGIGFSVFGFFAHSASEVDNFITGRVLGATSLGVYSRAFALMLIIYTVLAGVIEHATFPLFSKIQKDIERVSRAYSRHMSFTWSILSFLCTQLIVVAPELVYVLYGPKWNAVIDPLQILLLFLILRGGFKVNENLLQSQGAINKLLISQIIYLTVVSVGVYFGSRLGVKGVAIGASIGTSFNFLVSLFLVHRILPTFSIISFFLNLLKSLGFMLILFGVSWLLVMQFRILEIKDYYILLIEAILLLVYIFTIWKLKPPIFQSEILLLETNLPALIRKVRNK